MADKRRVAPQPSPTPKSNNDVRSNLNTQQEVQRATVAHLSTMNASKMEPKTKNFIPHTSRSLLCIRFVAVAFWAKKQVFFFKVGTPVTYFCPTLDPPLDRYGRNILMHIRGHKHFILTKFHKHPSCGSVVKAICVPPFVHLNIFIKLDMCLWNTDAPGGNKVKIWQNL